MERVSFAEQVTPKDTKRHQGQKYSSLALVSFVAKFLSDRVALAQHAIYEWDWQSYYREVATPDLRYPA